MNKITSLILTALLLFSLGAAVAQTTNAPSASPAPKSETGLKVSAIIGDHMVLQQKMADPIWGWDKPGTKVTVSFAGKEYTATAGSDGKWMVKLDSMPANATPQTMTITGSSKLELTDILIGEVWVCSGQSNMGRPLKPSPPQKPLENWEKEAASANYPTLRHIRIQSTVATSPMPTLTSVMGGWNVCSPSSVMNFSAVGYYFGRDLVKHLDVPVGLIHGSTGGSKAEAWTSHEMLASNPALAPILQRYSNDVVATYPERLARFQADEARVKADYATACAQALAQGKPTPRPPSLTPPVDPAKGNVHTPSGLFNGVIHPILHYAMRGVIWYQGETNIDRAAEYRDLFPALIADWRARWGEGDFPFLFVQLAPYRGTPPDIREAQFLTLAKAANTAMVVTTDCGDASDIHPNRKEPVGQRLALAARSLAYGEKLEYSGPLYSASRIEGNKVILSFTHTGSGLMAKDGPLKGFTIAGADQKFVPAQAEITGEAVTVSSPEVNTPAAVRYGWSNVPDVNLFNKDGLPASPFRTDNFPTTSDPKSIQPASSAKTFPSANPAQH